jgi:hypothetical protein
MRSIERNRSMATVKYVSSPDEIPGEINYVLVKLDKANGLQRHSRGLTVTIDRSQEPNLREAHTATVIGEAQVMADQEHIDTVFVCIPKRA